MIIITFYVQERRGDEGGRWDDLENSKLGTSLPDELNPFV